MMLSRLTPMDSPNPASIQSRPDSHRPWDLARPAAALLGLVAVVFFTLGAASQMADIATGLFVTQLLCFLLPAFLFARASNASARSFLGWDRGLGLAVIALLLLVSTANYFVAAAFMGLCTQLLPESWQFADAAKVLAAEEGLRLSGIIVAVVVLAPFCEETLFRGALQRSFVQRLGPRVGILLTAVAFSALHADPIGFLPRIELGLLFGWLAWRTGSLAAPILAHAVNNGAATVLFFLSGFESEPERDASFGLLLGFLAIGVVILIPTLVAFHRIAPPRETHEPVRLDESRPIALRPDSLEVSLLGALLLVALGTFAVFVAAQVSR